MAAPEFSIFPNAFSGIERRVVTRVSSDEDASQDANDWSTGSNHSLRARHGMLCGRANTPCVSLVSSRWAFVRLR
jgi:hypothetical protein